MWSNNGAQFEYSTCEDAVHNLLVEVGAGMLSLMLYYRIVLVDESLTLQIEMYNRILCHIRQKVESILCHRDVMTDGIIGESDDFRLEVGCHHIVVKIRVGQANHHIALLGKPCLVVDIALYTSFFTVYHQHHIQLDRTLNRFSSNLVDYH